MSLVDQLYEDVQPAANDSEAWQSGDLPDVARQINQILKPESQSEIQLQTMADKIAHSNIP